MPSQTFFNLPKEKQDRIMAAAREEFFTHSFDEASINRLIKAAGIPRGSFYQYFDDKEDVYFYLGEQIQRKMLVESHQQLKEYDYDPIKMARKVLPLWLKEIFYGENKMFFYRQIDLLYQQHLPHPRAGNYPMDPLDCLSREELGKMAEKVNLQDQGDLKFLLHALLLTMISCITEGAADYKAGRKVDLDKLKQQLDRRISYLENGFKKS
ncbi:TetR/AcrR family transcriptional regulator [Lactobacillus sp.]|uniref:TetR/AcrR family transcriptional regulator n=1 Tax=Lactobacillus sp. TaxID=1591 RepID=UPI003F0BCF60